jgi:hypothetical protein
MTMDDRFMNQMRRDPDSKFARSLREKLREKEPSPVLRALRPAPALAFAAAGLVVVALFAFPEVRVSAQAMLDLFRVRQFEAVQIDDSHLDRLKDLQGDNTLMVFDRHVKLVDPGPPQEFASLDAAIAATGLVARRPSFMPNGVVADTVLVVGASSGQLSVSEAKLRALLDALALADVAVPSGLDGKLIEMRKEPAIIQRFEKGQWRATLVQSKSPELSVPAGFDMERIAEIGLRVLGLDAAEARRVARNTDWRSTLLVPVPVNASTFRQVTVRGQKGLMITTSGERSEDGDRRRTGTVVLWSDGDQVFGVTGNMSPQEVLMMAESVQ